MRLLLLSSEFPPGPGGIGTHAYEVASHLHRQGWQVRVVTRQDFVDDTEIAAFNAAQPFEIVRLPSVSFVPLQGVMHWLALTRELGAFRPDVVLGSGQRSVWLAAAAASGIRWAAVAHGTELTVPSRFERSLNRWAFQHADAVISVSAYTQQILLAQDIQPRAKFVIGNGASPERFWPLQPDDAARFYQWLGLPDGARLLLTVGNVTPRKGQDVVITALPEILRAQPDTHYIIAGLPTKQSEFSALARSLRVENHVHFLGRVDAETLNACMNVCDVFVMASRHTHYGDFEGYGIAAVEAALCGKPSVVTDNSGLSEAVSDGVTGLVVPDGDSAALARAIVSLLNDETLRLEMGSAARERALREQTWPQRGAEYHQVLSSLISATSTGRGVNESSKIY